MANTTVTLGPMARVYINAIFTIPLGVVSGVMQFAADTPDKSDTEHWPFRKTATGGLRVAEIALELQYESNRNIHDASIFPTYALNEGAGFTCHILPNKQQTSIVYYFPKMVCAGISHGFQVAGSAPQGIRLSARSDEGYWKPGEATLYSTPTGSLSVQNLSHFDPYYSGQPTGFTFPIAVAGGGGSPFLAAPGELSAYGVPPVMGAASAPSGSTGPRQASEAELKRAFVDRLRAANAAAESRSSQRSSVSVPAGVPKAVDSPTKA